MDVDNSTVCHHGDLPNDLSVISHHTSPLFSLIKSHNFSESHKTGINNIDGHNRDICHDLALS